VFFRFAGITPQNRESEENRKIKSKHFIKQQEMRLTVRRISKRPFYSVFKPPVQYKA